MSAKSWILPVKPIVRNVPIEEVRLYWREIGPANKCLCPNEECKKQLPVTLEEEAAIDREEDVAVVCHSCFYLTVFSRGVIEGCVAPRKVTRFTETFY